MDSERRRRVLIVDDEANQRSAFSTMVERWGFVAETAADGQQALDKLPLFEPHAIVTDVMMPGMDGMELLRRLNEIAGAPPVIVLTAFGSIDAALTTVHEHSAFWFVEKPIRPWGKTGKPARVFSEFSYKTKKRKKGGWGWERRVVAKAEHIDGKENPRFVVTSLSAEQWAPQALYEELYCARGEMENRIKEQFPALKRLQTMSKLLACALAAASILTGQTVVTYRSAVDRSEQPYALYVPKSYVPGHRYPVVVSLHEEESNHVVNLKRVFGIPARYGETGLQALSTLAVLRAVDYLVACPFARGTMGYQGIAEQDVYDVLADVKRRYSVDEDRVYLTGASMGGGGALWLGLTRPDVWAAVAPVCADVFPGTVDLAPNALNLPMRLFHGDLDPAVAVESSRQWQRRLLTLDSPVEYIEFPGVRHNAWDLAYQNGAIFDWFGKYRRNANPDHVRLVTRDLRYAAAYWVRIDALAPGVLASVDAVRSPGGVRVQTRDVDAFTLGTTAKAVTIDGAAVRLRPAAVLSFTKTPQGWMQSPPPAAALQGPIVEAVNARHIYVYAAGDPSTRRYAESAAAWSSNRSRLNLTLPVKSDEEVNDDDLSSANLVLFGTPQTNRLMARFAPQFPIALQPGAADYGLLFILPAGKHYVLVSSGLPWWTGAEEANRGGYRFAPEPYRLLSTFGDYILFKGSLANVLAEGRFDRNGKVGPEVAEKLRAAGTVTMVK